MTIARYLFVLLLAPALMAGKCTSGGGGGPTPPQYPFVLAHGMLGAETYAELLDYWNGIVDEMEDEGAEVYVTQVSALHDSYVRGAKLQTQVENIIATTGAAKVHLIGHSQGGLDIRYVAGMRPDLVASVTTIGSPHQGAPVASFIADGINQDGSFASALLTFFGALLTPVVELIGGTSDPLDAKAALTLLAPSGMAAFNATFPDGLPAGCNPGPAVVSGIRYYSWTGRVTTTNVLDLTDPLMGIAGLFYLGEANDGLVTVCSAQFGDVIDDGLIMNHLDEVNQILGLTSFFEVDPRTLYRDHVRRLADLGL
ncbi:MAG: triacylglycerol lipase [bacterium]|nr:triacylglycerol lipase [bacterium]